MCDVTVTRRNEMSESKRCVACGKENDDIQDRWCKSCQKAQAMGQAHFLDPRHHWKLVPTFTEGNEYDSGDTCDEQDGW